MMGQDDGSYFVRFRLNASNPDDARAKLVALKGALGDHVPNFAYMTTTVVYLGSLEGLYFGGVDCRGFHSYLAAVQHVRAGVAAAGAPSDPITEAAELFAEVV